MYWGMMLVIKNIQMLDDEGNLNQMMIKLDGDRIVEIGQDLVGDTYLDGNNCLVAPAFIDAHTHTRNPGQSHKETVASLHKAAVAGGYGHVFAMPNTSPIIDDEKSLIESINLNNQGPIKVWQYAALSKDLVNETPLDYANLKSHGAIAFSNDGRGVQKEDVIKKMMLKLRDIDSMYVSHSEIDCLLDGGVMHDGVQAKVLGLPGISSSVEAIAVAKEIILAHELGCKYHVCHISSAMSVDLVRLYKSYGASVSCEVSPHHLVLCDEDIKVDNPNYKMNPPLRSRDDRAALIKGLNDKTIEIIATDHAPHATEEKGSSFIGSAFGITGLETAFDLIYQNLVLTEMVSLKTVIDAMTINPARRFNLDAGEIKVGARADLVFIDLNHQGKIDVAKHSSLAKNTPFDGYQVSSKIAKTMIGGEVVYEH